MVIQYQHKSIARLLSVARAAYTATAAQAYDTPGGPGRPARAPTRCGRRPARPAARRCGLRGGRGGRSAPRDARFHKERAEGRSMVARAAVARWRRGGAGARDGGRWRRREGGQQREPGGGAATSRWSTRRSGRAHSRARPRLSDAQGSNLRAPSLVTGVQLLGLVCRELDDHRPHREHWRSRTGSTGGAAANPLSPAEMWQEMKIGIYLRRDVADRVCCVRR